MGEAPEGEQKCIKRIPSISTDYSLAEFDNVLEKSTGSFRVLHKSINSIIFSHYYLESASYCEFSIGKSAKTFIACQTLANLCVMRLYDDSSAPYREFQNIARKRMANCRGQEDWKMFMP